MFPHAARVYPITDVRLTGLSHADQVDRLIAGGASFVQLREKHLPPNDFYQQAEDALRVGRRQGVPILINDRVDIALALKADGVHLGQDDISPQAARDLLGDAAIIGYSTHNLEQAIRARRLPIDYLAIGPIFETSSKDDPQPAVGLNGVREVRNVLGDFPLVAIGGISQQNAREVLAAGADCVAVISAVLAAPIGITEAIRLLISKAVSPD